MSRKAKRKAAAASQAEGQASGELLAKYRAHRRDRAWKFDANPVDCTWWEHVGEMSPFVDGVSSPVMRRLGGGEILRSSLLPAGACYALKNDQGYYPTGPDGLAIMVRLPDGEWWRIDSRASNCTMPDDDAHRCWVRHGTVGDLLTVDKKGNTCRAGAGSIQTDSYHGFLEDGRLVLQRRR